MSTAKTAAIAAGALVVGGFAGANLASPDLPAPGTAAEALAYLDKGAAYPVTAAIATEGVRHG